MYLFPNTRDENNGIKGLHLTTCNSVSKVRNMEHLLHVRDIPTGDISHRNDIPVMAQYIEMSKKILQSNFHCLAHFSCSIVSIMVLTISPVKRVMKTLLIPGFFTTTTSPSLSFISVPFLLHSAFCSYHHLNNFHDYLL